MNSAKKTALVVILFALALAAVGFGITRLRGRAAKRPDWMMSEPMTLIDEKTFATMTKPRLEWERLGRQGQNRYKNPDTGDYTMSPIIECGACRQQIPLPANLKSLDEMDAYLCPRCGRHVRQ